MGRHYDLARQMCNYWCNFIKTGNPNGQDNDGTPLPQWDSYTEENRCEMMFTGSGAKTGLESKNSLREFFIHHLSEDFKKQADILKKAE